MDCLFLSGISTSAQATTTIRKMSKARVSPFPPSIVNSNGSKLFVNGFNASPRSSVGFLPPMEDDKGDLGSKKRMHQTIRISLLLVFPMVLLLTMTIMSHVEAVRTQANANEVIRTIGTSLEVAELVRMLQIERGRTSMFLSSNRENQEVYTQLMKNRRDTDEKFKLVTDWSFVDIPELADSPLELRQPNFNIMLNTFRSNADLGYITVTQSLVFFTDLNVHLIGTLFSNVEAPAQYKFLVAFDNFARAADFAGVQRAVGAAFWIPCDYTESNRLWLIETHSDHGTMNEAAFRYFAPLKNSYFRIRDSHVPLWQDMERMVSNS